MPASLEPLSRYIPALIARQLNHSPAPLQHPLAEQFDAAVLFVDISGFTALTEQLAQRGPAGAEELSRLLNAFFTQLTDLIFAHGGDVVKFAGDALLALWPGELSEATRRATQCALAVQAALHNYPAENHTLRMKVGVSAGHLAAFYIGGTHGRWEFVLTGEPLAQVGHAEAQAQPGEVILSPEAWGLIQTQFAGEPLPTGAVRAQDVVQTLPPQVALSITINPEAEAALWTYLPGAIRARLAAQQSEWLTELRRVTVVFLNLPDLNHTTPLEQAQNIMLALQAALYRYEGSVNKISIDDKGSTLVAALGLPPLAHEDDPARGVRAAHGMQTALRALGARCAIGVTTGRVFCGTVGSDRRCEYTILGDIVNLAARLMQAALHHPTSALLCDAATAEAAAHQLAFAPLPALTVKGKAEPVAVFQPLAETRATLRAKTALVGRAAEQAQIAQQLSALNAGESSHLIIEGEAGIGKSRLVEALVEQARALGMTVLHGVGDAVEKATPYHAWRGVFAQLFGLDALNTTLEQQRQKVLAHLTQAHPDQFAHAPLLNAVLPLDLPQNDFTASLPNEGRANFTRELLLLLLREPARAGQLVVILEDVHWLDSRSWALVGYVAREIQPLMLALATRPIPEPLPREYQQFQPTAHTLALRALPPDEIEQLLARRLGVSHLPAPVLELIRAKAEGHPFFSEELLYALRDANLIVVTNDECRLAAGVNLSAVHFPDTVQGVITSRIDRLTPQQQLALKVASVIGRVFAYRTLQAVYPIETDKSQLPADLTALERLDLTPLETPPPQLEYIFKHIITQEVAYNLMTFAQRRQLHMAVVAWYEQTFADDLTPFYPLLAQHWIQVVNATTATEPLEARWMQKAMDYVEQAAEQALRNSANVEVVSLLNHLLTWRQRPQWAAVAETRSAHWEYLLGEAHLALGQIAQSETHFLRTAALLGYPEPPHAWRTLSFLWQATQAISSLVWKPSPSADPKQRSRLAQAAMTYTRLLLVISYTGDMPRTSYASVHAMNLASWAGVSPILARAEATLCIGIGSVGLHSLAERYCQQAVARAAADADPMSKATVDELSALYLASAGQLASAEKLLRQAADLFEQVGNLRGQNESQHVLVGVYTQQGRLAEGLALAEQVMTLAKRRQDSQMVLHGLCEMIEAGLPATLSLARAQTLLEEVRDQPFTSSDKLWVWGLLCLIYTRQAAWESAAQAAQIAIDLIQASTFVSFYILDAYNGPAEFFLSLWEHQLTDPTFAPLRPTAELQQQARAYSRRLQGLMWPFPATVPQVQRYQGWYEWLMGKPRQALDCWQKSLTHAQKFGMPLEEGWTHFEIGRHLPTSDPARAEHLQRAMELFKQCGAENDLRRVEGLL